MDYTLMQTQLLNTQLGLPMSVQAPRSEGIHVSSVIRCIATESGILKKEYVESLDLIDGSQEEWWEKLRPQDRLRISIGLAWEQWYIPQLGTVVDHPGEMEVDGIYMTHDGESIDYLLTDHAELALHEVKATYKSIKTVGDLSTQWMWLAQTKAYCRGLGTTVAYMHILYLCGDYKYPIVPVLQVWRLDYTQEEIEDNWDLITSYVRHRQLQEAEDTMKETV